MSEASHFQAVLTVGSSSPKCKPWGLEFLLRASPSASWTTYSFPMPKASNQGIPEAFPFFLLWSFLTPLSAFESLQKASFAYSHLLGLCLFPHNILNVSDGVSTEMYPYCGSTREVNMVVYVLLLFQGKSYMKTTQEPHASSGVSSDLSLMPSALPPCGQTPTLHLLPHCCRIPKKSKIILFLSYFSDLGQILLPTMQLLSFYITWEQGSFHSSMNMNLWNT